MSDAKNDKSSSESEFASPACSLSEAPPAYAFAQPLSRDEVLALLNLLIECERAGAKALAFFAKDDPPHAAADLIAEQMRDEARYVSGLSQAVERLGAQPSTATGDFFAKAKARDGWAARLDLLLRGQAWVEQRIRESLPLIGDAELHAYLTEMAETHARNIAAAQALRQNLPD